MRVVCAERKHFPLKIMDILDAFKKDMAAANLGIAIDGLGEFLDDVKHPPAIGGYALAEGICEYTRFVHENIWRDRTPEDKVLGAAIPALEAAEAKLSSIKNVALLSAEEQGKLGDWTINVTLRKDNIENHYLKGLSSAFPWAAIEPRLENQGKNQQQRPPEKRNP